MPDGLLEVDAFMDAYPGLTPPDVLGMELDWYDWLPVSRRARRRAAEMKDKSNAGPLTSGRHGPGG
jgi:hypothetical protein